MYVCHGLGLAMREHPSEVQDQCLSSMDWDYGTIDKQGFDPGVN